MCGEDKALTVQQKAVFSSQLLCGGVNLAQELHCSAHVIETRIEMQLLHGHGLKMLIMQNVINTNKNNPQAFLPIYNLLCPVSHQTS
jgi:hypothetical protein